MGGSLLVQGGISINDTGGNPRARPIGTVPDDRFKLLVASHRKLAPSNSSPQVVWDVKLVEGEVASEVRGVPSNLSVTVVSHGEDAAGICSNEKSGRKSDVVGHVTEHQMNGSG